MQWDNTHKITSIIIEVGEKVKVFCMSAWVLKDLPDWELREIDENKIIRIGKVVYTDEFLYGTEKGKG